MFPAAVGTKFMVPCPFTGKPLHRHADFYSVSSPLQTSETKQIYKGVLVKVSFQSLRVLAANLKRQGRGLSFLAASERCRKQGGKDWQVKRAAIFLQQNYPAGNFQNSPVEHGVALALAL